MSGPVKKLIGRQLDVGKSRRLCDQGNVTTPVIEDRFVSWDPKVFGGMVHRIQETVLDPEVNKRQYAAVGNGLDGGRPHVVRHTCAVFKEIREPCRLYDPNERNVENSTGDRNRWIRPGDNGNWCEPLENGNFVLDTLNHLRIGKRRRELLSAIYFGDVLDLLRR